MTAAPEEQFCTIKDGAAFLNTSVRSVYRLVSDPDVNLHFYRIDGLRRNHVRLKHSELRALIVKTGESR